MSVACYMCYVTCVCCVRYVRYDCDSLLCGVVVRVSCVFVRFMCVMCAMCVTYYVC